MKSFIIGDAQGEISSAMLLDHYEILIPGRGNRGLLDNSILMIVNASVLYIVIQVGHRNENRMVYFLTTAAYCVWKFK